MGKDKGIAIPENFTGLLEPLRGGPEDRVFAICDRGPISYPTLRLAFNDAVSKAKIPKITLHGLRHSIQTALLGRGVNPELLRATFGWTDESVHEDYTHRELYDLSPQLKLTDSFIDDNKLILGNRPFIKRIENRQTEDIEQINEPINTPPSNDHSSNENEPVVTKYNDISHKFFTGISYSYPLTF